MRELPTPLTAIAGSIILVGAIAFGINKLLMGGGSSGTKKDRGAD